MTVSSQGGMRICVCPLINLYIHLALEPSPFLLELPNFLCHLKHFCMKLKAEVFQVEDSIRELQQEINSANLSATR